MEDRASKRVMRDGLVNGSRSRGGTQRDLYGNEIIETEGKNARPWKALGKKQKATVEEVEVNPRARSATLRVAERL
jgi:16S rRNA (cytosine1402-N4)-methyltransferase